MVKKVNIKGDGAEPSAVKSPPRRSYKSIICIFCGRKVRCDKCNDKGEAEICNKCVREQSKK